MLLRLLSEQLLSLKAKMPVRDRPGADRGEERQEHEDGAIVPQPVRLRIPPPMSPPEHHDEHTDDGDPVPDDQERDPAVLQSGGAPGPRPGATPPRAAPPRPPRARGPDAGAPKRAAPRPRPPPLPP